MYNLELNRIEYEALISIIEDRINNKDLKKSELFYNFNYNDIVNEELRKTMALESDFNNECYKSILNKLLKHKEKHIKEIEKIENIKKDHYDSMTKGEKISYHLNSCNKVGISMDIDSILKLIENE